MSKVRDNLIWRLNNEIVNTKGDSDLSTLLCDLLDFISICDVTVKEPMDFRVDNKVDYVCSDGFSDLRKAPIKFGELKGKPVDLPRAPKTPEDYFSIQAKKYREKHGAKISFKDYVGKRIMFGHYPRFSNDIDSLIVLMSDYLEATRD